MAVAVLSVPTLSAFWGDRPADRAEVAAQLTECLNHLARVDAVLSRWRPKGGTRQEATAQAVLEIAPSDVAEYLVQQRTDVGRQPMPELGFSFAAWNGRHLGEDAAVSCTAGLSADRPGLRNAFVDTLPASWTVERAGAIEKTDHVASALRATWDPDEIAVFAGSERTVLWQRPGA